MQVREPEDDRRRRGDSGCLGRVEMFEASYLKTPGDLEDAGEVRDGASHRALVNEVHEGFHDGQVDVVEDYDWVLAGVGGEKSLVE